MFLTVCVEGMYRSWIKLYPNLDRAFTSSSSFFSLEGVKQEKTASAHDNSQREGGDTRRGGGGGGPALFTGASVFARSYEQK